jgi:hypothetical protein
MLASTQSLLAQAVALPSAERRLFLAELNFDEAARAAEHGIARALRGNNANLIADDQSPAPTRVVRGAIRRGELQGVKFGRRWFVDRDEHAQWLRSRGQRQFRKSPEKCEATIAEQLTAELRLVNGGRHG